MLPEKSLKIYYSIREVAQMFGVSESLLRFWEKEFPQIRPKKAGRGVRQYRREDVETIRLIFHLVKERGMTLQGARQCMASGERNEAVRRLEVMDRLKAIRDELVGMRDALAEDETSNDVSDKPELNQITS